MKVRLIAALTAMLVLGMVLVALPLAFSSGTGDFSAYDESPAGASQALQFLERQGYQGQNVGSSPVILSDTIPDATVLVVAGVERPYTPPEKESMDAFMQDGGVILLLDDFGYGADFSEPYGISYLTRPLLDQAFERNQSFVRVHAVLGNSESFGVLLNSPAALQDVDENDTALTPIIVSSDESYLDLNRDGTIGVEDKIGPFNVGIRRDIGDKGGALVVISDSGFVHNDMIGRAQNAEFLLGLVAQEIPAGGTVLFDESRRGSTGLETGFYWIEKALLNQFRSIPAAGILFMAAATAVAVLALVRLRGRESWTHVFTPKAAVDTSTHRTQRQMLLRILELKEAMDDGAAKAHDPVVHQALLDPESIAKDDVPIILERITKELELEVPEMPEDEEAPEEDAQAEPAPRPAGKPTPA